VNTLEVIDLFCKISRYHYGPGHIIIPRHIFEASSLISFGLVTLNAGMKKLEAQVMVSDIYSDNTLYISGNILETLLLPEDIFYQFVVEGTDIHLGPVIGLLWGKETSRLTSWRLYKALEHTSLYQNMKGLLCLFSWDKIDFQGRSIEGYYYKPGEAEIEGNWIKAILPLPDIIFRRGEIGRPEEKLLKHLTNNKFFNSFYFNKLTFWEISSSSEIISPFIPETRLLASIEDLDFMLTDHRAVYLKKRSGNKASGLIRVTKDSCYSFQNNDNLYPLEIENRADAGRYIKRLIAIRPYLVQQAVSSLKLDGRVIDFRIVMQKDESLSWKCTAIFSKVGRIEGICSNFTENGYTLTFEEALAKTTPLNEEEIMGKKLQLEEVCMKICMELDRTGENFGDVAIDAAIDQELKIWILEGNKEHDYNILLYVYSREKYIEIKSNPLRYAIGLSRFSLIK
jgi:hypothetical protein